MGDVIEFPSRTVQGWAQIERTLRETFSKSTATVEMQDEVIGQMKEVSQRYDLQFAVPFEMPANLSEQQKESVASPV